MGAHPYTLAYSGSHRLAATPDEVWRALERLDDYEAWCGWLHGLRVEGDGLRSGSVLHLTVVPPLPHHLRVHITLDRCVPSRSIDATVGGDLRGRGRLHLRPDGLATEARVTWDIELTQRPLRALARLARPLVLWGQDRIVDATLHGFVQQLRREPERRRNRRHDSNQR